MKTRRQILGQHFLRDFRAADILINALGTKKGEFVFEIGIGKGYVTEKLLNRGFKLAACEVDTKLFDLLKDKFSSQDNIRLLFEDARSIDISRLCSEYNVSKCHVTGNLPYSLSSQIIAYVCTFSGFIKTASFSVQLEVANRMVAGPGSANRCRFSCLVQYYSDCKIIKRLPPGAFAPPPKVWSAIVSMDFEKGLCGKNHAKDPKRLFNLIKAGFSHRRKTFLNSVSIYLAKSEKQFIGSLENAMKELSINRNIRAQDISLEQFVNLVLRLEP